MAVSWSWDEYNGTPVYASPSVEGVVNTHWGSVDAADLDPLTSILENGTNSFNKQQALRFSGFTGVEQADNFRLWGEHLASAGALIDKNGNANGDTLVFKDTGGKTTSAPSATAISGSSNVPASLPVGSNLAGGPVTLDGDGTNIFLTQVQVASASYHHGGGATIYITFDLFE